MSPLARCPRVEPRAFFFDNLPSLSWRFLFPRSRTYVHRVADGDGASSEGRESDDSPEVFATLMFQLPSDFDVEGGVFKVFDPSLPQVDTYAGTAGGAHAAAGAVGGAAAVNSGVSKGGQMTFSGRSRVHT